MKRPAEATAFRAAAFGAVCAVLAAFPVAALLALTFRFPVPFNGIDGGLDHVLPSLFAVLFYGIAMGGFPVLAVLGAVGGVTAHHLRKPEGRQVFLLTAWLSLATSSAALFLLATLDWIIGPW